MIDIHSHILPGVDDGARTLTDSVELVRELASVGVTDIIATPHYIVETNFISPRKVNLELLNSLKSTLANEQIDVRVFLGNEIYIDKSIESLLDAAKISTMADSRFLLVELPINGEFANYDDILMELMNHGYRVALAHPERYVIMQDDYELLVNLHEMGVLFQCNLGSIVGKYGREVKRQVKKLIKDRMVFAFGSDIHHCQGVNYWQTAQKKLAKYYSERELKQVLSVNARKMLPAESR